MKSKELGRITTLAKIYKKQPSAVLGISDPYTAFCFDEACAYIDAQLAAGKSPRYRMQVKSLHEFYSQI